MSRKLSIVLGLALACGCAAHEVHQPAPAPTTAVIFIPGFKGSVLRADKSHKIIWLDISYLTFNFKKSRLDIARVDLDELTLSPALDTTDPLSVAGILEEIPLFFGTIHLDIYKSWMQYLRQEFGNEAQVFSFSYDWRRDNIQNVEALSQFVDKLEHQGFTSINIVAHSMGGLITSYYLRYGTQLPEKAQENWAGAQHIQKVVFAGTPFQGALKIFLDMQTGVRTPVHGTLIPMKAINSFESSYQLMPSANVLEYSKENGELHPLDLFALENWQTYHLGLEDRGIMKESAENPEVSQFLQRVLAAAKLFRERINQPPNLPKPERLKILNIIGNTIPTPASAFIETLPGQSKYVLSENAMTKIDPQKHFPASEPGDNLVTVKSATLPLAFQNGTPIEVINTPASHGRFFRDTALRKTIVDFIKDSPRN